MNARCEADGHRWKAQPGDALGRWHRLVCMVCGGSEIRMGRGPDGMHYHRWILAGVSLYSQPEDRRRELLWLCKCGEHRYEIRVSPSHRKEPTVVVHDRNCGCDCGE